MKKCEDCDECVYICEGDFICTKGEPQIILTDFSFLKGDKPSGREYTYRSNIPVKVSDKVQINSSAKGIVTEVDVPKEEIAAFADKVKSIVGLVKESEDENEGTV
nr:MAG TPA: 4Fe-4S dicluster domain protein [Caudoviricetes sp.]